LFLFQIGAEADLQPLTSCSHPDTINPIHGIQVPEGCIAVNTYESSVYVGCERNIHKIALCTRQIAQPSPFILTPLNRISSVFVYNDQIYILHIGSLVNVYNLQGDWITNWSHSDNLRWVNQLVITKDQVIIPDRSNLTLVFYSLNGEVKKTLPCAFLKELQTRICIADRNSVIISQESSTLIIKLGLSNGNIVWKCRELKNPIGMTCYKDMFVFVIENNNSSYQLCILSLDTGQCCFGIVACRVCILY